jgi:hypothetical protein
MHQRSAAAAYPCRVSPRCPYIKPPCFKSGLPTTSPCYFASKSPSSSSLSSGYVSLGKHDVEYESAMISDSVALVSSYERVFYSSECVNADIEDATRCRLARIGAKLGTYVALGSHAHVRSVSCAEISDARTSGLNSWSTTEEVLDEVGEQMPCSSRWVCCSELSERGASDVRVFIL